MLKEYERWPAFVDDAENFAKQAVLNLSEKFRGLPLLDTPNITYRIKSPDSINKKLLINEGIIDDLIGIRVMFKHLASLHKSLTVIEDWAVGYELSNTKYENYFDYPKPGGYRAIHINYIFKFPLKFHLPIYSTLEIQLTTWLQSLHSIISHEVFYNTNDNHKEYLEKLGLELHNIDKEINEKIIK